MPFAAGSCAVTMEQAPKVSPRKRKREVRCLLTKTVATQPGDACRAVVACADPFLTNLLHVYMIGGLVHACSVEFCLQDPDLNIMLLANVHRVLYGGSKTVTTVSMGQNPISRQLLGASSAAIARP
jgi:hypothetical protein